MKKQVTVEEARKILDDEESRQLSDDQIEKVIQDLEVIAAMTIKAIMNGEFKPDKEHSIE